MRHNFFLGCLRGRKNCGGMDTQEYIDSLFPRYPPTPIPGMPLIRDVGNAVYPWVTIFGIVSYSKEDVCLTWGVSRRTGLGTTCTGMTVVTRRSGFLSRPPRRKDGLMEFLTDIADAQLKMLGIDAIRDLLNKYKASQQPNSTTKLTGFEEMLVTAILSSAAAGAYRR